MAKQTERNPIPALEEELTDEQWQDPDEWEEEGWHFEGGPPPKSVYAIVFEPEEIRKVEQAAERAGMLTTQFIREAAIARAAE